MPTIHACDGCGKKAPVEYAEYQQHIGAVYLRFHTSKEGSYCRECATKYFWMTTLVTFFFGWWGIISFFITPYTIVKNIITHAGVLRDFKEGVPTRGVPPAPPVPAAARPVAVAAAPPATRTLAAHQEAVIARMKNGDATAMIARDLAAQTGVPQEQAMQFVTETFRAHRDTIMS